MELRTKLEIGGGILAVFGIITAFGTGVIVGKNKTLKSVIALNYLKPEHLGMVMNEKNKLDMLIASQVTEEQTEVMISVFEELQAKGVDIEKEYPEEFKKIKLLKMMKEKEEEKKGDKE